MLRFGIIGFIFLVIGIGYARGQSYLTETGKIVFESDAPLRDFEGVSEKLHGLIDFDKNLLDFYVDLNTLKTGVKLRDKHMRDNYLETEEHPFAEFTGKLAEQPPSLEMIPQDSLMAVVAIGKFTIHGVTREITVEGTLQRLQNDLQLKATFTVLLTDYNIRKPSLLGYELADEQIVHVEATLSPKSP